jgi:copper chaperone CopZ
LTKITDGENEMIRDVISSLTLAVLLACGIGCNSPEQSITATGEDGSEIRVYEVFGMDCPGCQGGLEKLVKKIPAVQRAEANWQKKELAVSVRPGSELDDEDIYDATRRANFTPGKRIK